MSHIPRTTIAHAFRRTAVPLGSYYAITLALPLANGAAQSGAAFTKHALIVLVVPPLLIVFACAIQAIAHGWLFVRNVRYRVPGQ